MIGHSQAQYHSLDPADAAHRFIERYRTQQMGHIGASRTLLSLTSMSRIFLVWHINAQVLLVPLAPVLGTVFLSLPFPFGQDFDADAVNQEAQRRGAGTLGQLQLLSHLAPTRCAEVSNLPIQACQVQKTLHHAQAFARGKAD